jgi:Amt family ammonium transporter
MGALAIGLISGVACFTAATKLKRALGYDDSLDVFGVHGVGGIVGAVLTGVFIASNLGGVGLPEGVSMGKQVLAQVVGTAVTIVYCAIVSWVLLKLVDVMVGLRVSEEQETQGLDISLHDERGYNP